MPRVARHVRQHAAARAPKARREAALLVPLIAGVMLAYSYRERLFGLDLPIRIAAVVAMVILGWALARSLGRAVAPLLFGRLDPRHRGHRGVPGPARHARGGRAGGPEGT